MEVLFLGSMASSTVVCCDDCISCVNSSQCEEFMQENSNISGAKPEMLEMVVRDSMKSLTRNGHKVTLIARRVTLEQAERLFDF
jgi:uncharacterized Zn ribbon protein